MAAGFALEPALAAAMLTSEILLPAASMGKRADAEMAHGSMRSLKIS